MTIAPPASSRLRVPFYDLGPTSAAFRDSLLEDVAGLLDSGAFTNGPAVREFEEAFARYVGAGSCVGLASGLDALRLALLAGGLERGEEVVVPAATFAATFEAVTQAGGVPVVADVREDDYCLDPDAAADAISPRTRFLLPVHLYGQMADLPRADARGLPPRCRDRRGRLPGARRRARRERRGHRRDSGGLQLLPGQEPRRDRRRGRARDRRRGARRDGALAARARPGPEVPPRARGLHGTPRHDPGARPAAQASAPRRLDRRATCDRGALHGRARRRRRPASSGRPARQRARLAPLRRAHGRSGRARGLPRGARRSAAAATTRSRRTSRRRTRGSATGRARSRLRRRSRARRSPCRSSPA